jgi:hypothetical protein
LTTGLSFSLLLAFISLLQTVQTRKREMVRRRLVGGCEAMMAAVRHDSQCLMAAPEREESWRL